MANFQLRGEFLLLLIEFVAKLHEHQKIKFFITHLLIMVFLFFVAAVGLLMFSAEGSY